MSTPDPQSFDHDELGMRFTYHPPKVGQLALYERIRSIALDFAEFITEQTPASREQSLAITKLEEAVFWANAAVARRA